MHETEHPRPTLRQSQPGEVHVKHHQSSLRASVMSNIDEVDRQEQRQILIRLENEHSALDTQVAEISSVTGVDQITLSRLKRRKLQLKDAIVKLRSNVLPDQPA